MSYVYISLGAVAFPGIVIALVRWFQARRDAPEAELVPLTIEAIRSAPSEGALFKLLGDELSRRLPIRADRVAFTEALQELPRGLRAMAATYELDVSMALDDLGWHFGNWHCKPLAHETISGLRELGADKAAEIVEETFRLAEPYWAELGSEDWAAWYPDSPLSKSLDTLNEEMGAICGRSSKYGLMSYWLDYARRHPERVMD